ncbi:MAG: Ig-like domain-containing protein [Microbacteriaceae bacterium]
MASNDSDLRNTIGDVVTVNVLINDVAGSGALVPSSVTLLDGTGDPVTSPLVVTGEGTWTVNGTTGAITFTPEAGFKGDPTPVDYRVTDVNGQSDDATVTITYLPVASNDSSTGNTEGTAVTVDIIGNDTGVFDPTSVQLINPITGERVRTLIVSGEGTWTVNPTTGAITFTPQNGYTGDPTPVDYEITDLSGDVTTAQVTITYVHPAAGLVVTGADLAPALGGAALLLLIGGLAMFISRRRSHSAV